MCGVAEVQCSSAVRCAELRREHAASGTSLPGRGSCLPGDTSLLSRERLCLRVSQALEMVQEYSVVRWVIIILLLKYYV